MDTPGGRLTTKYAFIGTGKKLNNYLVADGMNERGVAIAELYFPNEAVYSEQIDSERLNLAPHEFIMWLLGEIGSIKELEGRIHEIQLMSIELKLLSTIIPLHFIVTDTSGRSIVIETNNNGLMIKDNPVGVMTNSPELEWHLKNLNNYLSIQPNNFSAKKMVSYEIKPFGQGAGTVGLPGGFTSPERFVRTVYNKTYTDYGKTAEENLNTIFMLLNNVTLPKGIVLQNDGVSDYTQYRAVFDVKTMHYYFNPYGTQTIYSIQLEDELLSLKEPKEYNVRTNFSTIPIQ